MIWAGRSMWKVSEIFENFEHISPTDRNQIYMALNKMKIQHLANCSLEANEFVCQHMEVKSIID